MSDNAVLSFNQILRHSPEVVKGLGSKLKGLKLVFQQRHNVISGLGVCLENAATRKPKALALIYRKDTYTYAQFNAWVNRYADYFSSTGTQKGDVVVVALENRPELLVVISALAKLGAVSALINTSQRGDVLKHSISLVKPKRVVAGAELLCAVTELEDTLPVEAASCLFIADDSVSVECPKAWVDLERESAACSEKNPVSTMQARANDPLCYFYTSGTTGLPKAAILTNGRYMKAYAGIGLACLQFTDQDRVYVPLPFYHATAMVVAWSSILAGNAALVLVRKFSASNYWKDVVDNGVTALCYIGELCRYLLAQEPSALDRSHKVRLMFGNGLRPELWEAFKQRFGVSRVNEFYGSSEGNVGFLNFLNLDYTVGFTPVPYAIIQYDVDADQAVRFSDGFMRKVSKGEAGLLLGEISDKSPFDGYTDPEKTKQTILRNVFKQGDAWFNTGDLMRDLGFRHAQFVDRLGDTFRWKGENVSTTEVENVISQSDRVLDAAVYGVEIPGTNGRAGMAAIRLMPEQKLDLGELYALLNSKLPSYAVPVFIRVVESIDTTGTHKYKKAPLKKEAFDPVVCGSDLFVLLPKSKAYERLTKDAHQKIVGKEVPF
jgi:citronellyl-CoA synthetase